MRGSTVAILESRMGRQMVELVERLGGVAFHAPALKEVPDIDSAFVAALVEQLQGEPPAIAIFQTGVGTRALFQTTDALGITPKLLASLEQAIVAVRGPKPTAALRSRQLRIDRYAADPFTTHEVLTSLEGLAFDGARVVVQRYGVTNVELEEALRAKGAEVLEIPTYRWALPDDTSPLRELLDALDQRRIDAVAFTNAAQVHNLFAVAEGLGRSDRLRAALNATLVASIGPVSSSALEKFGVKVGIESHPPKLGAFMSALDAALPQ